MLGFLIGEDLRNGAQATMFRPPAGLVLIHCGLGKPRLEQRRDLTSL